MTNIDIPSASALRDVKLLGGFRDDELAELVSMGEAFSVESHANIMIEGDTSGGMFLLLEGQVGVTKANPMANNQVGGNQYDLGHLQAGSVFGELSLIDNNPRSATVRALTECKIFHISRDKFDAFLANDESRRIRFYQSCIQTMIARLRETDQKYVISQYQLWKTALSKRKGAA